MIHKEAGEMVTLQSPRHRASSRGSSCLTGRPLAHEKMEKLLRDTQILKEKEVEAEKGEASGFESLHR